MKRKLLLVATAVLSFLGLTIAQSPQQMNYQAIVRDASGHPLAANTTVTVRFTIHQGSPTGTTVFQETNTAVTNQFGLITPVLGGTGNLSAVSWGSGPMYLQVEIDPAGGSNFTDMGTTQLLSVPYALFAANSGSGPQGPTGPQGAQGNQGVAGVTGPQGLAGATGTAGVNGGTGAAGATGPSGQDGATGAAGPTGASGQDGATGPSGQDGATGPSGQDGATGPSGQDGATGSSGQDGLTGATGPSGQDGSTGPSGQDGATGPSGQDGSTGATGPSGQDGSTGPSGQGGATGPSGQDGSTGATGPSGQDGSTGPSGQDGATGPSGQDGATGATGPSGQDGSTGPSGQDGATGPSGQDGSTGATGPSGQDGATGPSGQDGATGATGPSGQDGSTGPSGQDGATGPSGQDGSTGATGPSGQDGATGSTGSTGAVNISGTLNYVIKFTPDGVTGGNSQIYDDGTNVGVGTVSPSHNLSVQSGFNVDEAGLNAGFLNQSGTAGNGISFGTGGSGEGIASNRNGGNQYGLDFYTNFTNRVAITNGGNVGIGILAPAYPLDVSGYARASGEIIGTLASGYGQFRAIAGNYGAFIRNDGSDTYIPLFTASGDQYGVWNGLRPMRVENSSGDIYFANSQIYMEHSNGYMGIGTTSPNNQLEVNGAVRVDAQPIYLNGGADNNHYIVLDNTSGNGQNGPKIAGYYGADFYRTAYSEVLAQIYDYQICPSQSCTYNSSNGWLFVNDVWSQYNGYWLDNNNDLDAIDAIKPMISTDPRTGITRTVNDPSTLPFNIAMPPNQDGRTAVSLTQMGALSLGAIRELRHETKTRDEAIEARLVRVENLLTQLTGKQLGQMDFTASATAYKGLQSYVIMDARITRNSKVNIDGLSEYSVTLGEGSLEIRFKTPPATDTKFTYSSKF